MGYGWKMRDAVDLTVGAARKALSSIISHGAVLHAGTLQADDENSGVICVGGKNVAVGRGGQLVAGGWPAPQPIARADFLSEPEEGRKPNS